MSLINTVLDTVLHSVLYFVMQVILNTTLKDVLQTDYQHQSVRSNWPQITGESRQFIHTVTAEALTLPLSTV